MAKGLQEAVGALVLSRKVGESIDVGGIIRITYQAQQGKIAKLLIEAPRDIHVKRTELADREEKTDAA